ncbi:MAG: hypothetical protein ABWZ77_05175 [Naasia sp.]
MSDTFDPGPGWREVERVPTSVEDVASARIGGVWHYFAREAPVPLPTEPGYYLTTEPDYGGGPVVVELLNSPAGQWVDAGDRQYLNADQVRDMLPLVRLEPRAVTAKAVLDRFYRAWLDDDDVTEAIDIVQREFGVDQ